MALPIHTASSLSLLFLPYRMNIIIVKTYVVFLCVSTIRYCLLYLLELIIFSTILFDRNILGGAFSLCLHRVCPVLCHFLSVSLTLVTVHWSPATFLFFCCFPSILHTNYVRLCAACLCHLFDSCLIFVFLLFAHNSNKKLNGISIRINNEIENSSKI